MQCKDGQVLDVQVHTLTNKVLIKFSDSDLADSYGDRLKAGVNWPDIGNVSVTGYRQDSDFTTLRIVNVDPEVHDFEVESEMAKLCQEIATCSRDVITTHGLRCYGGVVTVQAKVENLLALPPFLHLPRTPTTGPQVWGIHHRLQVGPRACFKCGVQGHIASGCPEYQSRASYSAKLAGRDQEREDRLDQQAKELQDKAKEEERIRKLEEEEEERLRKEEKEETARKNKEKEDKLAQVEKERFEKEIKAKEAREHASLAKQKKEREEEAARVKKAEEQKAEEKKAEEKAAKKKQAEEEAAEREAKAKQTEKEAAQVKWAAAEVAKAMEDQASKQKEALSHLKFIQPGNVDSDESSVESLTPHQYGRADFPLSPAAIVEPPDFLPIGVSLSPTQSETQPSQSPMTKKEKQKLKKEEKNETKRKASQGSSGSQPAKSMKPSRGGPKPNSQ